MSLFELHIWGGIDGMSSFMPDSLAAVWYVTLSVGVEKVRIIQSSNLRLAKNGELPVLRHDGNVLGGFQNIVRYLETTGVGLDEKLDVIERRKLKAMVSYIKSAVSPITLYTLFVNKSNYTDKISPLLANLVPFPMQYYLTHEQREYANNICSSVGLVSSTKAQWSLATDNNNDDPTMNRIRKQLEAKHKAEKARKSTLKSAQDTFRVLNVAKDAFDCLLELAVVKNESPWLFSDRPNSADLFLLANLKLQTLATLPDPIVLQLLKQKYPQLLKYTGIEPLESKLNITEPTGDESYSLPSLVKSYIGMNTVWA